MVDIEKGIKAYSREGLAEFMKSAGMPAFRAKQIEQWLYQKGATSYDEMTNLSKDMRAKLAETAPLYSAEIDDRQVSCDGTRKYIVRYADGCTAEMVAMPSGDRLTVCVSSQVGCAMACHRQRGIHAQFAPRRDCRASTDRSERYGHPREQRGYHGSRRTVFELRQYPCSPSFPEWQRWAQHWRAPHYGFDVRHSRWHSSIRRGTRVVYSGGFSAFRHPGNS